jgi:RNA polymerase sigma factor (TIGR02999 family)
MRSQDDDITGLLRRFENDEEDVKSELINLVYDELRVMARRYVARERPGHSIQTTALVHEAYLRLVKMQGVDWHNRNHFFAIAAKVMRHILVDHARRYLAGDLGGKQNLLTLEDELRIPQTPERWSQVLDVDRALQKLTAIDARSARVIELRFFGGLSMEETAEALQTPLRSIERDWTFGRAWLRDALSGQ